MGEGQGRSPGRIYIVGRHCLLVFWKGNWRLKRKQNIVSIPCQAQCLSIPYILIISVTTKGRGVFYRDSFIMGEDRVLGFSMDQDTSPGVVKSRTLFMIPLSLSYSFLSCPVTLFSSSLKRLCQGWAVGAVSCQRSLAPSDLLVTWEPGHAAHLPSSAAGPCLGKPREQCGRGPEPQTRAAVLVLPLL